MSENLLVCEGSYQGYPVQAHSITRKPGVTPDSGWIELAYEDFRALVIRDDFRLWQVAGVKEPAGPFIEAVARGITRPTITTTPLPTADGFFRGGPLILKTKLGSQLGGDDREIDKDGTVTLDPIFISPSGLEGIIRDLENATKHNEGKVRVNVTDFRHFWQRHGTPVFGRYNMLLENGQFDESTVDQATGSPHILRNMLNMLALALPGSPSIDQNSQLDGLREPVDQEYKMILPIGPLHRLVRAYDLELHLTHSSQILLKRRGRKHEVRKFRRAPGDTPRPLPIVILPDDPNEEVKTVFVVDRPEGVTVVGERRQRRVTAHCIPAFIDENNEVRAMEDLPKLWGYSIEKAFVQAFVRNERQYSDVSGEGKVKFNRMRIASKYFFKMFVPESLFTPKPPTGGQDVPTGGGGEPRKFWPFEERKHPLFPMLDPWFLPDEVKDIKEVKLKVKKERPFVNVDAVPLVSVDILVRASIIDQRHIEDVAELIDFIRGFIETHEEVRDRFSDQRGLKFAELRRVINLEKPDEYQQLGGITGGFAVFLNKAGDEIIRTVGAAISDGVAKLVDDTARLRANRATQRNILRFEIEDLNIKILEVERNIAAVKAQEAAARRNLEDYGFARAWVNVPWGVVEEGRYNVQKERGIILFNEVVGIMKAAMTYDLENTELDSPGHVEVSYMSEVDIDSPTEMSSWTFVANPKGEGDPALCRISDISLLKTMVILEPKLVMMEDEVGVVMNANETTQKAMRLARTVLDQPRQQDGYFYKFPGFWKVITDDSVNQVDWIFDGDMGHTQIIANNPEMDGGYQALARKRLAEEVLYGKARG